MRKLGVLLVLAFALTACAGAPQRSSFGALGAIPSEASTTRLVGTHGIELAVPVAWPDNKGWCGVPQANTVLWNEDAIQDCLPSQPRGLSAVEFGGVPPSPSARRTTINGVPVRETLARRGDGSLEVRLDVLGHGITVVVMSPHRALLRRIIGSLRAVRTDASGCPTSTPSDAAYRLGSRPQREAFVPKGAVGVVACSYAERWVDRSNRLGRGGAARLIRALDAAPHGSSRPPRASILDSYCGTAWRESHIVARFEYAHRAPVTVTAHLDGCSRLGASNGSWSIRIRPRWVFRLVDDASFGGGFADPRSFR